MTVTVRSFRGLVLALMVLVLASGLGFAGAQREAAEPDAELEVWTFVDTHARWFREMAEVFGPEIAPGFAVDVSVVAYSEMHDRLLVSLQTGIGAPDISDVEQGRFGAFLRDRPVGFVDLTERLERGGHLDNIVASRLSLYQDAEGRAYGIEHALTPVVLYYRADVFDEHGITADDLKTWDDFIRVGMDLSDDTRKMFALEAGYLTILLRQRGTGWFDEQGRIQADTDPIILDTLEWLLAMRDDYGIAGERADEDAAHYAALREGRYLTQLGADWFAGFFKDNLPEMEGMWRAMPLPVWPDDPEGRNTSVFGGTGATITRFSEKIDLAWSFLEASMLSVEGNVRRFELTNLFPPYIPAWDDERLYQEDPYFDGQVLGRLFAEVGENAPKQNQAVNLTMVHSTLWPENYWLDVLDGRMEPRAALERLARDVRERED